MVRVIIHIPKYLLENLTGSAVLNATYLSRKLLKVIHLTVPAMTNTVIIKHLKWLLMETAVFPLCRFNF
jgi:hypothetical protein